MWSVPHMKHASVIVPGRASLAKRRHGMVGINAWGGPAGHQGGVERHKVAMGIDWMTGDELAQAIPPVFTEYIGRQMLARALRVVEESQAKVSEVAITDSEKESARWGRPI